MASRRATHREQEWLGYTALETSKTVKIVLRFVLHSLKELSKGFRT
jgi:hypothetical protein